MKIQVFRFTGLSPLLMSNIESVNRDLPVLKLGVKPGKGDIETIAEGMTYRDDDGTYYLPTQALRSSLLKGSVGTKFPGSRMSPKNIFKGVVFAAEERATILDKKGYPVLKHVAQIDSAVNKSTKARIIVVRPRIDEWMLEVPIEIDEEFAPGNFDTFMESLLLVWNRAGRSAGVGAWRPENEGRFGRYSVEMI